MTRMRTGAIAFLVVAMLGAVAGPAGAGGRGDPIYGDFNADGLTDLTYLGTVNPDRCSVIIQYAESPGVFRAPIAQIYTRPGATDGACPDIGVAFDWDDSPGDELWIGWAESPPEDLPYNRLILDDTTFRPIATFASPIIPVFLGIADFVGDGRLTPYSYGTGGFATYLRDPGGGGSLGPLGWCSADTPSIALNDIDRNRRLDALVSYTDGCTDTANGVVVVFDDGTARQLELSPARDRSWSARIVYANGDRYPDIRTQDRATGALSHFINVGDRTFVEAPHANPDAFYPATSGKVLVDVLANDHTTGTSRITIVTPPAHGRVQILSDRRIAYTPTVTPARTDRFVYRLTEDGRQSTTSVYVRYPS